MIIERIYPMEMVRSVQSVESVPQTMAINKPSILLTEKQERFCQHYSINFDAVAAYRSAYDCFKMSEDTIRVDAWKMVRHPEVAKRIEFYRDAHARVIFADHAVTVARLMEIETEIALADPNDLIETIVCPCRRCWGEGHRHQWIEIEYIEAMEAWERLQPKVREVTPMPDIGGGFGYDGKAKPNPECPHCLGGGESRTFMKATATLPPGARRLYKGVKVTRNGVEVLMHDQDAARERIGRMLGAYKDVLRITGAVGMLNVTLPTDAQAAEQVYRQLIQGGG